MLKVYKASAGSGKTFQLVVEYLKLILKNANNYKHILAVTFTNKATNEMKSRILEQLYLLSNNQESDYLAILQKENDYSEIFIRSRAKLVLRSILHDYNRFSISTIDSFTQKVIKAFNRELGISPNFTLELDSDIILEEAVDNLLSKINKDKKLLNWLKDFSREKIENNRSQRIDDDIKALGKELFKENFQIFFPEESDSVYNRKNLLNFNKELRETQKYFENTLKNKGVEAVNKMESTGLLPADFSGGTTRSIGAFFIKLYNDVLPNFTKTVREHGENSEKWSSKSNKKRAEIIQVAESLLRPILIEIITYYDQNFEKYSTAIAILKQLRMLGILTDLKEEIKTLLHEKGMLQISDSNLFLSKIIGQSDSPFVYEKIGNTYKHFMLDEFQDTSGLQWNNFKPLLQNSISEGNSNLIVGDVKQSIYRWRNSDWNILAEQLDTEFLATQLKNFTLKENWRSDKNIITFNNAIIKGLTNSFENYLFSSLDEETENQIEKFRKIYGSFYQEPGNKEKDDTGHVNVCFVEKENFYPDSTKLLVEQIKKLQDKGLKASDIAILIRKNKEGHAIIEEFLSEAKKEENKSYNLSILSNESLFLHASKGVQFTMGVIEFFINPENEIIKANLLHLWLNWLKTASSSTNNQVDTDTYNFDSLDNWQLEENYKEVFENELGEKLEKAKDKILLTSLDETIMHICDLFEIFKIPSELPFIQTLIDKAGELKTSLSNDLSNFIFWWKEKGFKTSVNVNEEIDSVRLLTVHKSKGLEFKAVLLPYLNWDTSWSGTLAPILWCKPKSKPFNSFPLLPIRAGKDMAASEFKEIYFKEKTNYFIDTLNLAYVAITRAKSALIINCPVPSNSNTNTGKPIHFLLNKALEEISGNDIFSNCWNEDKTNFEYGSIPFFQNAQKSEPSILVDKYSFNDFSEKIKLRLSGEDFLVNDKNQKSVKNRGKIVHEILAGIETFEDIKGACLRALCTGLIAENELDYYLETIRHNLNKKEIKNWFNGSYKILNERDLLTKEKILRPDRVMVLNDEAIVVDYKTGEIKSDKYYYQVNRYAKTLKETGFKKVSGFLWYINREEVEKVCEL